MACAVTQLRAASAQGQGRERARAIPKSQRCHRVTSVCRPQRARGAAWALPSPRELLGTAGHRCKAALGQAAPVPAAWSCPQLGDQWVASGINMRRWFVPRLRPGGCWLKPAEGLGREKRARVSAGLWTRCLDWPRCLISPSERVRQCPFLKSWKDHKNSTFRGCLCLLLFEVSPPVRWTGNASLKENWAARRRAWPWEPDPPQQQSTTQLLKTCRSQGHQQLGKRLAFVLEHHPVPAASQCFGEGFLKLSPSRNRGRGDVGCADIGCCCGMSMRMRPAHVTPHAEAGHCSLRPEEAFGEDVPNWDRPCNVALQCHGCRWAPWARYWQQPAGPGDLAVPDPVPRARFQLWLWWEPAWVQDAQAVTLVCSHRSACCRLPSERHRGDSR